MKTKSKPLYNVQEIQIKSKARHMQKLVSHHENRIRVVKSSIQLQAKEDED